MENIDLEALYRLLMSNDAAFYGIVALIILLLFAVAWRLSRSARIQTTPEEEEIETSKSEEDLIADQVLGQARHEIESAERIDEPQIKSTNRQGGRDWTSTQHGGPTDTVEVFRSLSTDSSAGPEYQVRPVGEVVREAPPKPKPIAKPEPKPEPKPAPKPEPKPVPKPEPEKPKSLEEGLSKTKAGFISKLNNLVRGKKQIGDDVFEGLEEILYEADIGPTATRLFDSVAESAKRNELKDASRIKELLREEISGILSKAEQPFEISASQPHVIIMVGVNGVGKTTTIGKLAKKYLAEGKTVLLAAADTFRAAAVEQLVEWGRRAGVDVITAKEGANPSGVVYNAVQAARARNVDVLIVDTAGRLHTKYNLMEELKKIISVAGKALEREPEDIWLVIDANTGQNAVNQATKFNDALNLSGLILTKLDGTAKGGVVIGITDQLGLPIRFIGIGEKVEDLRPFNAEDFVNALF